MRKRYETSSDVHNEKIALSVPDTSIMYEGAKKFIYKIIEKRNLNLLIN